MYSPYEYVYLPFFLIPQNYQTELVQPTSNVNRLLKLEYCLRTTPNVLKQKQ